MVTILAEAVLFLGGVWIYSKATSAKNGFGKYGFLGLVIFLLLIQFANMAGPPPENVEAIAWVGQAQWLLVILALFVDKNRVAMRTDQGRPSIIDA